MLKRDLAVTLVLASLSVAAACFPRGWNRDDPTIPMSLDSPFRVGPYLQRMDEHRSALVIEHALRAAPQLKYWVLTSTRATSSTTAADVRTATFQHRPNDLWVAVMDELPHDVQIGYEITSEVGEFGPTAFRQGISRGKPFRFAAFGDTRTGHQIHRLLIDALVQEDIDFVINSGDLVEFGGYREDWITFFRIEQALIASRFLFAVVGNHDDSPQRYFERYFVTDLYAAGPRYYMQDYGDVRFVAMDSEVEIGRGSAQWNFIEKSLAEGAASGRWMVLSLHRPPYSSGEHGSELAMRAIVDELAPKYGVEIVLAGHDHDYERTKPQFGVTHIVAASAGATIRPVNPSEFTAVMRTEPHVVIFDVEKDRLVARTINLQGEIFDSFVVADNPPQVRP